jgi:hypothetical protein
MERLKNFLAKAPSVLRKWRVIKVGLVAYLSYLLWQIMEWIMVDPYKDLDGAVQSVVVSALVLGLITGLFKIIDKIDAPIEKDKDD